MYKLNHNDLYFIWKPNEEDKDPHRAIAYQIHSDQFDFIYKTSYQDFDDIAIEINDDKAASEKVDDDDNTEKYSEKN